MYLPIFSHSIILSIIIVLDKPPVYHMYRYTSLAQVYRSISAKPNLTTSRSLPPPASPHLGHLHYHWPRLNFLKVIRFLRSLPIHIVGYDSDEYVNKALQWVFNNITKNRIPIFHSIEECVLYLVHAGNGTQNNHLMISNITATTQR